MELSNWKVLNFYRPESELTPYSDLIAAHFRQQPPATIKEACHEIEMLTGLKRSEAQIRQFLLTLGLKRRKVGMIPAKAGPVEQERFRLEELEPVLEAAKEGKKKSLFCRCCPLCSGSLPGVSVVLFPHFHSSPRRQTTLQCAGGLGCHLPRTGYHYQ